MRTIRYACTRCHRVSDHTYADGGAPLSLHDECPSPGCRDHYTSTHTRVPLREHNERQARVFRRWSRWTGRPLDTETVPDLGRRYNLKHAA